MARKKTLTRPLRVSSLTSRRSRYTSASSMSITAPQISANLNHLLSDSSTRYSSVPMSPQVRLSRGRDVNSATHSAVNVFPAPGGPWRRKICPSPLLGMGSADQVLSFLLAFLEEVYL